CNSHKKPSNRRLALVTRSAGSIPKRLPPTAATMCNRPPISAMRLRPPPRSHRREDSGRREENAPLFFDLPISLSPFLSVSLSLRRRLGARQRPTAIRAGAVHKLRSRRRQPLSAADSGSRLRNG